MARLFFLTGKRAALLPCVADEFAVPAWTEAGSTTGAEPATARMNVQQTRIFNHRPLIRKSSGAKDLIVRVDELQPTPSIAEPLEIPAELLSSVHRHQAHLAALISSLRAAGLQDEMIENSVRALVDSYADELTTAIRAMAKERHHG